MTGANGVPPSLTVEGLAAVWQAIRARLDRNGPGYRARIRLTVDDPAAALALQSVLGHPMGATLDLTELETGLIRLGVGSDLADALHLLGHPASAEVTTRRERRIRTDARRARVGDGVGDWPEPWAARWAADTAASGALAGASDSEIDRLVADVRLLLDTVADGFASTRHGPVIRDERGRVSRVEVAARVFGSAHALDTDTLL